MLFLGKQFKWEVALAAFLYFIKILCALTASVCLQEMLIQITEPESAQSKTVACMYVVICGALWLIQQNTNHNAFHESASIMIRIRSELVFLMFAKLSKMSQFSAKAQ